MLKAVLPRGVTRYAGEKAVLLNRVNWPRKRIYKFYENAWKKSIRKRM